MSARYLSQLSMCMMLVSVSVSSAAQSMQLNPEKHTTTWLQNQQIVYRYGTDSNQFTPEWKKGDFWIFQHRFSFPEYAEVSDDEVSETFAWQMKPTKRKRIVLSGKQLEDAQSYFLKSCFCLERGYHKVTNGRIVMQRMQNGWWRVDFSFDITPKNGGQVMRIKRTNVLFKLSN